MGIFQMAGDKMKYLAWITGLLTLMLALFSFILSFNALTDLAAKHGVSIPPLFPFVVEFAVVIFSLNALYRSLHGEPAKVQWLLIIGSSLLAGFFNIAHAQEDSISRLMAAMPSLFLLLSFESFLNLIRYQVTRQGAIASIAELTRQGDRLQQDVTKQRDTLNGLSVQIEDKQTELDKLQQDIKQVTNAENLPSVPAFVLGDRAALDKAQEAKQDKVTERREQVLSLLEAGYDKTQIASELEVSVRTIGRDIRALNGQVTK